MNKVCKLKIDPKFYELIAEGEKKHEVRKTNKDYINSGDIIMFTNNGVVLGFARVIYSDSFSTKAVLNAPTIDEETKEFARKNYSNESLLFVMRIEHLTTHQEKGEQNE